MPRDRRTAAVLLLVCALLLGWWVLPEEASVDPAAPPPTAAARRNRPSHPLLTGHPEAADALKEVHPPVPSRAATPPEATPGQALMPGRVIDETGAGVAGAKIHVRQTMPQVDIGFIPIDFFLFPKVVTAVDGSFEVLLPESEPCIVLAGATTETSPSTPQLVQTTASFVTLRVQRAANLGGVVLDPHGVPLASQVVSLTTAEWPIPQKVAADTEGRFVARVAPQATGVTLRVGLLENEKPPEGAALGDRLYDVQVGRWDLVLRLRAPVFLRGTVHGFDGKALRSGSVSAHRAHEDPVTMRLSAGIDGKTGMFALGPLRPGGWVLVALPSRGGYAMSERTAVEAPTDEARVFCPMTPGIHGRVEGKDVEGYNVTWQDAHSPIGERCSAVKVSSDGTFHIQGLRNAPHHLYVSRRGDPRMAELRAVHPDVLPLTIRLEPGLAIAGTFPGGKAQRGRRVIAKRGFIEADILVDEHGRFRVTGLSPGEWRLYIVHRGSSMEWISGVGRAVYAGTTEVRLGE